MAPSRLGHAPESEEYWNSPAFDDTLIPSQESRAEVFEFIEGIYSLRRRHRYLG